MLLEWELSLMVVSEFLVVCLHIVLVDVGSWWYNLMGSVLTSAQHEEVSLSL